VSVEFELKISREVAWTTLRDHATSALAARLGVPVEQLGVSLVAGPHSSSSLGPFRAVLDVRAGEDGLVELMTIEVPDFPVADDETGWFVFVTMDRSAESATLGMILAASLAELLATPVIDEVSLLRKGRFPSSDDIWSCLRPAGSFRRTAIATCAPLGLTFGDTE
jgi:hypothetical protein